MKGTHARTVKPPDDNDGDAFSLTINAARSVEISGDAFILRVAVTAKRGGQLIEKEPTAIAARLSEFKDEAQARRWADEAFRSLREHLTAALLAEAVQTTSDEAHRALADVRGDPIDFDAVIRGHAKATTKRLRKQFNRPGRRAQWTRDELLEATRAAVGPLPKGERTVAAAADRLKQTHPDKAPASPAALKTMLSRYGVSWREVMR